MHDTPNPIDVIVGNNVRERRVAIGMTQHGLATECGLTFQQIQKYEKGQNRISASRLVDIARALKCDILELFAGVEDKAQQIETRSLVHLRLEKRGAESYSSLPPDIQKALCNLMQAMSIALGERLRAASGGA